MRRLALLGLAALALCACALPGLWIARSGALQAKHGVVQVTDLVAHEVLKVTRPFAVGRAYAGEALDFHPVPPESALLLDHSRRHRAGVTVAPVPPVPEVAPPAVTAEPTEPAEPAEPSQPRMPIVVHPRSGDMMRIGQDIHIETDQTVTGDVVAMGGDIVVDGHVEGDVQAMGGDVYLNSGSRVDGDVFCMGGQLHEQPGSQVGGQRVTALGPKDKRWERRAARLHEVSEHTRDWTHRGSRVFASLLWLLITTGLAWGFFKLGPGRSAAALARFRGEAGSSFLVGLLMALVWVPGFVVVALVAALLCITLIGIPVAVVLLLAYPSVVALLWIWGFAIGAAAIGHRIAAWRGGPAPSAAACAAYGALALGGAMFVGTLLKQVPSLGLFEGLGTLIKVLAWCALAVVSTLGAGALLREEFTHGPMRRWWNGRRDGPLTGVPPVAPAPAAAPAGPAMIIDPPAPPPPPPPPPPASPPSAFFPPGDPPPPA